MGSKPTPSPESSPTPGCVPALLVFTVVCLALSALLSWWFLAGLGLPVLCLYTWASKRRFVRRADRELRQQGFLGILVTSDSPNWRSYIEESWLPRMRGRFLVFNWSRHEQWPRSTPVLLFHRLVGTDRNYCPSIVLLRGTAAPLVFRFFYAFRNAKHGNSEALVSLERRLWEEMEKQLTEPGGQPPQVIVSGHEDG